MIYFVLENLGQKTARPAPEFFTVLVIRFDCRICPTQNFSVKPSARKTALEQVFLLFRELYYFRIYKNQIFGNIFSAFRYALPAHKFFRKNFSGNDKNFERHADLRRSNSYSVVLFAERQGHVFQNFLNFRRGDFINRPFFGFLAENFMGLLKYRERHKISNYSNCSNF